jgi:hypothetical protein
VQVFGPRNLSVPPDPPVFAVGTGRCGTHFLAEVFRSDPLYDVRHFDDVFPTGDTFHRYCAFHGLPVDVGGLLWARQCLVDEAAREGRIYFESNGMLAFHVRELHERLGARFVLVVRNPLEVVPSLVAQGIYDSPIALDDPSLVTGFQYNVERPNHALSPLVPREPEYSSWTRLTTVGKSAWLWHTINSRTLGLLEELPEDRWRVLRIEEFDYNAYRSLGEITRISPIGQETFQALRASRPGRTSGARSLRPAREWSEREMEEVIGITRRTAEELGYLFDASTKRVAIRSARERR